MVIIPKLTNFIIFFNTYQLKSFRTMGNQYCTFRNDSPSTVTIKTYGYDDYAFRKSYQNEVIKSNTQVKLQAPPNAFGLRFEVVYSSSDMQ